MLDWFTRWRIKEERGEDARPAFAGEKLRSYRFRDAAGRERTLTEFEGPLILVLLPSVPDFGTAYYLQSLKTKISRVRRRQTRVVVVTCPEYLQTVVALSGDLTVLSDESGEAMLDLVNEETPTIYILGSEHEVINRLEDTGNDGEPMAA